MPPEPPPSSLPPPRFATGPVEADRMCVEAVRALVAHVERRLAAGPVVAPRPIEDLSWRHLAKAAGTARSAIALIDDARFTDACILVRAVFEQLFSYLWVVQEPAKAEARAVMVTIKQEWANAKYLDGLAPGASPEAAGHLAEAAEAYRRVAEALMAGLAAELGTTEKKVRDEAKLRVSAKAIEVNLGPEFSLPYAHYSGFVHTDGNALASYGRAVEGGVAYDLKGARPARVPMGADLHRALLRLAIETTARVGDAWPESAALWADHQAWQAEMDARRRTSTPPDDANF